MTFEQFTERAYKGLKADLTKGKPHWDDLSEKEQGKYINSYGNIEVSNKMIIDGEFPIIFPDKWDSDFYCKFCNSLKSLDGAPRYVTGDFNCDECTSLVEIGDTLKEVKGMFWGRSTKLTREKIKAKIKAGWIML